MKKINLNQFYSFLILIFLIFISLKINAQIRVPFTQRTSQYSPTKKIYNVKGDFTLMGNTNLTLQNYNDNQPNNNNFMRYVDVDNDPTTWNSSSSTLQFSSENGANPNCSKIVYAGLYWTGRAAIDNASSTDVFSVTNSTNVVNQPINNDLVVGHDQNITNTNYNLIVSRNNISSLKNPVYTFIGSGNTYEFDFTNNIGINALTLSINSATPINIPVILSNSGTNTIATFVTPYIIVDGTLNITINSLLRDSQTDLGTGPTLDTSFANVNVSGLYTGTLPITRTYDKRIISLKGPNSTTYTQFTANANDINYPNTNDAYIYAGYKEITDYVRANGIGEYFAADIALKEGNGGGSGYYGGWGMIVVYENQLMKQRDVTIFDGYAFVTGTGDFDLPISGINTVQSGPVGIKLGLMAAEGDRPFTGDYFRIQKQSDSTYLDLIHSGNASDNFFNSSIVTGGNPRNPNLLNNTSIDLCMFEIPNINNEVITNNQTSVNFKYGSTFETVVIYTIAMSVDAYIPNVDVLIIPQNINGNPIVGSTITTQPDDIIEMKIEIRNSGNEPVNNSRFVVPIPYTATYVPGSLSKNLYFTPNPIPNNCYFDPSLSTNGSIVWDFGTLPLPANPSVLLADYTFKIKITNDCAILKNTACGQNASISGLSSGVGAITGITFSDKDYFIGYNNVGTCVGLPILDPLPIAIDATNFVQLNCQSTPDIREFTFCNIPNATIPITDVSGAFPAGTLFYNQFPITSTSIQYTISNPFPGTVGTFNYIAVPPTTNSGCFYTFRITIANAPMVPITTHVTYCQGEIAQPLESNLNNPENTLYYYNSLTSGAQLSITPSTATVGQFTFYVAEASSGTCISDKVAIIVTINPTPIATAPILTIIQGCSTDVIMDLVYSENAVTITLDQFLAYGGTYTNYNLNPFISYIDTKSGTCPIIVTRVFTINCVCFDQTFTQIINIQDTINPTANSLIDLVVSGCNATFPVADISLISANDNCSTPIVAFVSDSAPNVVGCVETIIRKYSVTDVCGNSIFVPQNLIRTIDNENPTANSLIDLTVSGCNATFPTPNISLITAADNCSTPTVAFVSDSAPNVVGCVETIIRKYSVTDVCGNSIFVNQNLIRTIDNENPTANSLIDLVVSSCNATFPVADISLISANDNCSTPIVAFVSDSVPNVVGCVETIIRKYSVTDVCGNSIYVNQNLIRTIDNENPTANSLNDFTVSGCNSSFPNPDISLVVANDNCSTPIVAFVSDSVPNVVGCVETIIRKYSVTDVCGNSIYVNQNLIRTIDAVLPILTSILNTNINVNCDEIPSKPDLVFTDNCSSLVNVVYNQSDSTPVNGTFTIIRTWIASDNCSNTTTITQTINVTIQNNFASINQELCNLESEVLSMNGLLPANLVRLGTWIDTNNSGGILNNGLGQFSAFGINAGNYNLTYQINDPICPKKFEIRMKITTDCQVLGVSECVIKVMNAVSPNNDGNNDTFFIENLDCYPDNKVEIFNRWGILVYEGEHYDNKSITFSGISNGRTVVSKDEMLPAGTYFYILKYKENNGTAIDKSGYLHLNK